MNVIEQMLTGKMKMPEFIRLLETDAQLQDQIRSLIPPEAVGNDSCLLWKSISYDSLSRVNFDFLLHLRWICRFDGSLGDNLNLFGSIKRVYTYSFPKTVCTEEYFDAHGLYLDVIRDCYDGPEVNDLVQGIIKEALTQRYKKNRIAQAKDEIMKQFHITGTTRPRWIQGPEWPMGLHSPMRFVMQKRRGDAIEYSFVDVDSAETRIITQYY